MTRCVPPQSWCPAVAGVPERLRAREVAELPPDERYKTAVSNATEFSAFTGLLSNPDHAKSVESLGPYVMLSSDLKYAVSISRIARSQHNGVSHIIAKL